MQYPRWRLPERFKTKLSQYRFEIRHFIVLFSVLISFQIILALFQKSQLGNFLGETQSWFQKYYAERLALVTATSLELLYENQQRVRLETDSLDNNTVYSFNVILKQQLVHRSVEDICLLLIKNRRTYVIDSGTKLAAFLDGSLSPYEVDTLLVHSSGVRYFLAARDELRDREKILSSASNAKTFDVLVPFVPDGEYLGAVYMRITPDFTFLTDEIQANFDKVSIIFSALIFIGLIAIFVVSSRAVRERNKAQEELFLEHGENLKQQVRLEKESLFTKRIYHTHHKAEKIMGFIKDDVRKMNPENLGELKRRVITYSNFISRIIYDMKWYDQDINTILNPMFRTSINNIIEFIVRNVFLRISSKNEMFEFSLALDPAVPHVSVNEFTVWEILEPLIQNSIDHGGRSFVTIRIETCYDPGTHVTRVIIADNGVGIAEELLEPGPKGIKRVFLENETTKSQSSSHSGYGCYIAHQMAVGKCGWQLDAENLPDGGCRFTITIRNQVPV